MSDATALNELNRARFMLLTTFRRSGVPVSTPVWVALESGALVVTTPAGSGTVKRLRRDPAVQLQACSRRGTPAPGAPVENGTATIEVGPAERDRAGAAIRQKYGLEYRMVMGLERLLKRGNRDRVILRIRPR